MADKTVLLVGTRKGAFVLESDRKRTKWSARGPLCEGWPIHAMAIEPNSGTIYAAGGSPWYGPAVWRSDDLGETWSHSSNGLTYGDDDTKKIATVWGIAQRNGTVYAGVEPAGLFRSDDRGETWQHVEGLTNHPTRDKWQPGGGGLCLHSIVPHPTDPNRVWVGISAVGTFETRDGGKTWETRNNGVRADFMPPDQQFPEFGQCVHKLVLADGKERMYQQNHSGVFRTADGGKRWEDITEGLPSTFGFPMGVHPSRPDTIWTIPLNGADRGRYVPDGKSAVWRSDDAGKTWERCSEGLPQSNAYHTVLRDAMAVEANDPVGVYFGTTGGELYGSSDEGRTWREIQAHLPDVWSVEAAVVG